MAPPNIVVVGSINMDLVARVARLPQPGETVLGEHLAYVPGGKGANQAVAAARLGVNVTMIGRVGDDPFGQTLLAVLRNEKIGTQHVAVVPDCSSGVAWIGVADDGMNAITVISGANGKLTPDDVNALENFIAAADALVLQLEIPLQTAAAASRLARKHRVRVILDAAPAPSSSLPDDLLHVDVLTPNQTEAEAMTGIVIKDAAAAVQAAQQLQRNGAKTVVIKLGEQGAVWLDESGRTGHVPAQKIEAVDTTAAGDAFTAALSIALAEGQPLPAAVEWGCAAGTLAAMTHGAQPSIPTREAVERFANSQE